MRSVAGRAALDLYGLVLVDERPLFVGVTLEANQVLRCRRPQLPGEKAAVRIVAVRALYNSLVHAMMERSRKLLLCFEVAAVEKQRLLFLHEELALFGMVRIVAVRAANIVL